MLYFVYCIYQHTDVCCTFINIKYNKQLSKVYTNKDESTFFLNRYLNSYLYHVRNLIGFNQIIL